MAPNIFEKGQCTLTDALMKKHIKSLIFGSKFRHYISMRIEAGNRHYIYAFLFVNTKRLIEEGSTVL